MTVSSMAKVRALARRMGKRLSKKELAAAMAEMDEDGSGEVDFSEFAAWWRAAAVKKGHGVFGGFFSKISIGFLKSARPELGGVGNAVDGFTLAAMEGTEAEAARCAAEAAAAAAEAAEAEAEALHEAERKAEASRMLQARMGGTNTPLRGSYVATTADANDARMAALYGGSGGMVEELAAQEIKLAAQVRPPNMDYPPKR